MLDLIIVLIAVLMGVFSALMGMFPIYALFLGAIIAIGVAALLNYNTFTRIIGIITGILLIIIAFSTEWFDNIEMLKTFSLDVQASVGCFLLAFVIIFSLVIFFTPWGNRIEEAERNMSQEERSRNRAKNSFGRFIIKMEGVKNLVSIGNEFL